MQRRSPNWARAKIISDAARHFFHRASWRAGRFPQRLIEGAKPQGEIEAALVVQMACTHAASMAVLARLVGGHGPDDRTMAVRASAAGRLLRAYATQVETLRRLRNGGSQIVRVEHVHVNEGGQALIGNVRKDGSGGETKNETAATCGALIGGNDTYHCPRDIFFWNEYVRRSASSITFSAAPPRCH